MAIGETDGRGGQRGLNGGLARGREREGGKQKVVLSSRSHLWRDIFGSPLSVHDTEIGEGTNERSELRAMHFAIYGLAGWPQYADRVAGSGPKYRWRTARDLEIDPPRMIRRQRAGHNGREELKRLDQGQKMKGEIGREGGYLQIAPSAAFIHCRAQSMRSSMGLAASTN